MGVPADIEKERSGIETDFKVKAAYSPADMTKPAEIAGMIALGEKHLGSVDILVNNAGIQFVSPIEEFPPEKWEAIIAINLSSAFHAHPRRGARHEEARLGPHHQHRLGAFAGRLAVQVGLCRRPSTASPASPRPWRWSSRPSRSPATASSPGYVWTPLVENQIPETMKARSMTKEQVIHDVLLAAQPTKEFVTSEQVAALALFLCGDDAAQITGANLSIDGGWTAE